MSLREELGQRAFEAYQNVRGVTVPKWADLTIESQEAWCAAAGAVGIHVVALYGDKCQRCIDYRPNGKCAHDKCEHPEIANASDLKGLAARTSRA